MSCSRFYMPREPFIDSPVSSLTEKNNLPPSHFSILHAHTWTTKDYLQ